MAASRVCRKRPGTVALAASLHLLLRIPRAPADHEAGAMQLNLNVICADG
jgi:hypothetical protein